MLYVLLAYAPSVLAGIHAVRTGRAQQWLWILIIAPGLGAAIYFFAEILPELMGGRTARGVRRGVVRALDPERELRQALVALEDTPTVGNRMRAANAAATLGRWEDAEMHLRQCVYGQYAEDPVILLAHANALIELGRFGEALTRLEALKALGKEGETGLAALAFARTYEGLGRLSEADAPYRFAADRVPGLEAGARYVAYLARAGRAEDARVGLAEIERRYSKISPPLRAEARIWRDLAAKALAGGQ